MPAIHFEEYQDAIRNTVCNVCVCFLEDKENPGRCVHEHSGQCSLFAHLSDVVHMVSSIDSRGIESYTAALRQQVCAKCDHQDERGVCNLRDSHEPVPTWCILDAYFNLIVGAVEDVQNLHRGEA